MNYKLWLKLAPEGYRDCNFIGTGFFLEDDPGVLYTARHVFASPKNRFGDQIFWSQYDSNIKITISNLSEAYLLFPKEDNQFEVMAFGSYTKVIDSDLSDLLKIDFESRFESFKKFVRPLKRALNRPKPNEQLFLAGYGLGNYNHENYKDPFKVSIALTGSIATPRLISRGYGSDIIESYSEHQRLFPHKIYTLTEMPVKTRIAPYDEDYITTAISQFTMWIGNQFLLRGDTGSGASGGTALNSYGEVIGVISNGNDAMGLSLVVNLTSKSSSKKP